MGSELDLSLDPCKLTGFIKGHRVGSIQYIIPSLEETRGETGGGKKAGGEHSFRKSRELQRNENYPEFSRHSSVMRASSCAWNSPWLQRAQEGSKGILQ